MLTESAVKNALPRSKAYKLSDYAGLYLRVTPSGSRLWRLKYRRDGKERCMSFGPYPVVSLAQARKYRDHAKAQLRAGIDPMEAIRVRRAREQSRREARGFRLELSKAGELTVSTRYQSFRLSAAHTSALRSFLIAGFESQGEENATD